MPVSKLRPNRKVARKLTAKDHINIQHAYREKYEQYSQMDVEDLKILRDSSTIKGTYLVALLEAIRVKELPVKEVLEEVTA